MTTEPDFLFEGRWAWRLNSYAVRPGAEVGSVRREWEARAARTRRPRWQRRVRGIVFTLVLVLPTAVGSLAAQRLLTLSHDPHPLLLVLAILLPLLALVGGCAAGFRLSPRLWPLAEEDIPSEGTSLDIELVQKELAEWARQQPGVSQEVVWKLARVMARQSDVAWAWWHCLRGQGYEAVSHRLLTRWVVERDELARCAGDVGFVPPLIYLSDDPEDLSVEIGEYRDVTIATSGPALSGKGRSGHGW